MRLDIGFAALFERADRLAPERLAHLALESGRALDERSYLSALDNLAQPPLHLRRSMKVFLLKSSELIAC